MSDSTSSREILSEMHDRTLLITLNRPNQLNALTESMETSYLELLQEADNDPSVRAIVVTGAGRGFCAGADLGRLSGAAQSSDDSQRLHHRTSEMAFGLRKPMIAAINGAAVGLGLIHALFCDVRFCTPEAKLGTAFASRGLIAEYGVAWLLPRIVGHSRASDLLLSARIVQGTEALGLGLVDWVVDPTEIVDAALEYATRLSANSSPWSMAMMKKQLLDSSTSDFHSSAAQARALMEESFIRADFKEGLDAYNERRPPEFEAVGLH